MGSAIDELVGLHTDEVRRFMISGLANRLFRNVEHDSPRDKVDWATAETFIGRVISEAELAALTKQFLVFVAYEQLRKEKPELPSVRHDMMFPDVEEDYEENCRQVSSVLSSLGREKLTSLINCVNEQERGNYLELILGRHAWELYQNIRRSELLIEGCYGKIGFY